MYQSLFEDTSLFCLLRKTDGDLAREVQAAGCPACGGTLHRGSFWRKPPGAAAGLGREHRERFSFCCAQEGWGRRVMPASVRFMGSKVYLGPVVVLVAALSEGATGKRGEWLPELLWVSRRTLGRWRRWWRETVPVTRFWQAARGRWRRRRCRRACWRPSTPPPSRCRGWCRCRSSWVR